LKFFSFEDKPPVGATRRSNGGTLHGDTDDVGPMAVPRTDAGKKAQKSSRGPRASQIAREGASLDDDDDYDEDEDSEAGAYTRPPLRST
jgi:hypothetical protein